MFHILGTLSAALSLLACLSAPLAAQVDSAAVFRTDSSLLVLHATVLDRDGHLVTDLPREAFHVYENGVEQQLKVFRREDAPVSLGFVIDDSGSMINKRQRVAAALLALLNASHPDDEAFVLHFNEKSYLDTDFTHDRARLEHGLKTFDSRGTTAMRDAIRLATEHEQRRASEDKKVLVIITDGEDNTSQIARDYIVKAAQQSGVIVYAIGILNEVPDAETRAARAELDAITEATGGRAFYLDDVSQADRTAQLIAHEIRSQYTLAYSPANQDLDGSYRKIEVVAATPKLLTVLTRSGYWANGEASARNRAPAP